MRKLCDIWINDCSLVVSFPTTSTNGFYFQFKYKYTKQMKKYPNQKSIIEISFLFCLWIQNVSCFTFNTLCGFYLCVVSLSRRSNNLIYQCKIQTKKLIGTTPKLVLSLERLFFFVAFAQKYLMFVHFSINMILLSFRTLKCFIYACVRFSNFK